MQELIRLMGIKVQKMENAVGCDFLLDISNPARQLNG